MHLASLYGHTLSVKTKKRTNLGLNLDIRYICLDLNLGSVFFSKEICMMHTPAMS